MLFSVGSGEKLLETNNMKHQILFVKKVCSHCRHFKANPVNAKLSELSNYCDASRMKIFMGLVRKWDDKTYDENEHYDFKPDCFVDKIKGRSLEKLV